MEKKQHPVTQMSDPGDAMIYEENPKERLKLHIHHFGYTALSFG